MVLLPLSIFYFELKEEEKKRSELAYILGLDKRLSQQELYLKLLHSCVSKIDLTQDEPLIYVRCPRIPADLEARIGYKRSNHNPHKKVKVFGYQAMITTNIQVEIGLEVSFYSFPDLEKKISPLTLIPSHNLGKFSPTFYEGVFFVLSKNR